MLNRRSGTLLSLVIVLSATAALAHDEGTGSDAAKVSLKPSAPAKWDLVLPGETPLKLTSGPDGGLMIPIAHAGGPGFVCKSEGPSLAVDTDGDGKVDDKVKGAGGTVVLKGKTAAGLPLSYTVRVVPSGESWQYLPGNVMAGNIAGQDVRLVDLNGNGKFDEFGVDAIIVGRGTSGSYLSKVLNLGGKLYDVTVDADGQSLTASPYSGETGTLNVASAWKSTGAELCSAVVKSSTGEWSFELSAARNGMLVPVGDYTLTNGSAKKGGESVKIRGNAMRPFSVSSQKTTQVAWGGPVYMDFEYTVSKGTITVPATMKFIGTAGEEYYEFKPDAKSPKVIVIDKESKAVVAEGRFGGC